MHVGLSFAAVFSSFEGSFVHSPGSWQRELYIRECEILIILSTPMCQFIGTNLVFQNQLYRDLIESWLYLALNHMVRIQWQRQDPAGLKELTV